jgi:hypothetical protein
MPEASWLLGVQRLGPFPGFHRGSASVDIGKNFTKRVECDQLAGAF